MLSSAEPAEDTYSSWKLASLRKDRKLLAYGVRILVALDSVIAFSNATSELDITGQKITKFDQAPKTLMLESNHVNLNKCTTNKEQ